MLIFTELLIDRSKVRDPYLMLLLKALGCELVRGSAWVVVRKEVAAEHGLAELVLVCQPKVAAAA